MEGRVGTRAHFQRKKYLNIYYTDTFWTNFIYRMPTFKNKNFLAVLCNHSESDVYYSWPWFVESWLLGQRLIKSNQFVTSLPLFSLTTSHPSTQISANAVLPISTKTHPLLRNEWVKNRVSLVKKAKVAVNPKILQLELWREMFSTKYGLNGPIKEI